MGCYSNELKHKCAKIVLIVSIFIGILGLVTTIFGFLQTGDGQQYAADYAQFDVEGGFAAGTIVGGVFCIVTAVLGCAAGKFKKFFFTVPFLVLSFILFIFLAIAGGILAGDKGTLTDLVEEACAQTYENFEGKSTKELIEEQYFELVDKNMCTDLCKCNADSMTPWETKGDEYIRGYSRTIDPTAEETTAYETDSTTAEIIPFITSSDSTEYVANFKECYDNSLQADLESKEDSTDSDVQKYVKTAQDFFQKGGYDMLK